MREHTLWFASFVRGESSFTSGDTSNRGNVSNWGVPAMARDRTGVPLLQHGEQLGFPCLKSMEGVGPKGLSGIPRVVGTWAFPSPGPKELPQSMPEWAKASRHWPVSTSQAWERGVVAPVLFKARTPLPKTREDNFSSYEKAEEEGRESTLPLAHEGATSSSPSFQAPNSWEGSKVEKQGSSSHQSCRAKQEGPATTYSELGCCQPLVTTRTLAHLRFRRSAVFSSIATNLPQESPNFLKRLLPQRCKGRPKILTHTRRAPPLSPSRHPTDGFHFSRQKLFPLKRLVPKLYTLSTLSANSNSRSKRFSLTFDSHRFPSKN